MELKCTKEELNYLIKNNVIEPLSNNEFILYTKADLRGENHKFKVTYTIGNIATVRNEQVVNIEKTIEEWYKDFRQAFPTDINKLLGYSSEGSSLRSGNKVKIKSKIKELIKSGYNMESVITAVKYEVWLRTNESKKTANNTLMYMKRMGSWINDTGNIDTMIERSIQSTEFKLYRNKDTRELPNVPKSKLY
ncbi:MAG: hypothetical protein HRU40_16975 [Saprospiraceae bacterium]|nr:hypothetical protein [Saprospiraceae bacterium]